MVETSVLIEKLTEKGYTANEVTLPCILLEKDSKKLYSSLLTYEAMDDADTIVGYIDKSFTDAYGTESE